MILKLSQLQRRMLEAGEFHVDGWTSLAGQSAATELLALGLVTSFEGGDSQYTAINYTITDAGRAALLS
jgi:hypothetical protein